MRKSIPLRERFGRLLDLPHEAVSHEPYIELSGRSVVRVTSCGDVTQLSPSLISLDCMEYSVTVHGEGLNITELDEGSVTLVGSVCSVSLDAVGS